MATPDEKNLVDPSIRRREWRMRRIDEDNERAAQVAAAAIEEAAVEDEALFERRNLQPEYAIADMRSQLMWLMYAAFIALIVAVTLFLVLGFLTNNTLFWVPPPPSRMYEYEALYSEAYNQSEPMNSFEQFIHYLFSHAPALSSECYDLTAVVCEPFLLALPNTTYTKLIRGDLDLFNGLRRKTPPPKRFWDWDILRTPFQDVPFRYTFTKKEIDKLAKCIAYISAQREMSLRENRVADPGGWSTPPAFNNKSAVFLVIGICRLVDTGIPKKFEYQRIANTPGLMERLDLLRQLCLIGCGENISLGDIDWSILCDALHFLTPEIRALHGCAWLNITTADCADTLSMATNICRREALAITTSSTKTTRRSSTTEIPSTTINLTNSTERTTSPANVTDETGS